ncbi:uncharacterized protein LOC142467609 isoform X2 [Ascaphus truei]|uniref:uncharacterized protein LOC142467609 isoform X2 n=1 Tax=Ascaphus truei TaxID=8439 RepID=UPI003F5A663D
MASLPVSATVQGAGLQEQQQEEEQLWLYGGVYTHEEEDGPASGNARMSNALQDTSAESRSGRPKQRDVSQQVSQSCITNEEDSESDDDDDEDDNVKVTIGDIKTGAPFYMGSAVNPSVKPNRSFGASGKLQSRGVDVSAPGCINGSPVLEVDLDSFEEKPWRKPGKLQSRGVDVTAPGCINGSPVLEVDLDSFEEKPWRKPGADLSDYFNYGFNEATWKAYCEKQRRLRTGSDAIYHPLGMENKKTVQQGRIRTSQKGGENGCVKTELKPHVAAPGGGRIRGETSPNGKLGGTIDVIGGVISSITRVEGRRWNTPVPDENPIQFLGDHGYQPHPTVHQQQHLPPLLPLPSVAPSRPPPSNPPPFSGHPPLNFFHRPPPTAQGPPPMHPPALLPPSLVPQSAHIPPHNGPHAAYLSRPPPLHGYSSADSGFMSYAAVSMPHTHWVTTTDKATNSMGSSNWTSRRERDRERARSQTPNDYNNNEDHRYLHYTQERAYEYERKYRRSSERSLEQEDRSREQADRSREQADRSRAREQADRSREQVDRSREREREDRAREQVDRSRAREQADRSLEREESKNPKSSPTKPDGEEKESHRRHKRKKSKRGKEEKRDLQ